MDLAVSVSDPDRTLKVGKLRPGVVQSWAMKLFCSVKYEILTSRSCRSSIQYVHAAYYFGRVLGSFARGFLLASTSLCLLRL